MIPLISHLSEAGKVLSCCWRRWRQKAGRVGHLPYICVEWSKYGPMVLQYFKNHWIVWLFNKFFIMCNHYDNWVYGFCVQFFHGCSTTLRDHRTIGPKLLSDAMVMILHRGGWGSTFGPWYQGTMVPWLHPIQWNWAGDWSIWMDPIVSLDRSPTSYGLGGLSCKIQVGFIICLKLVASL